MKDIYRNPAVMLPTVLIVSLAMGSCRGGNETPESSSVPEERTEWTIDNISTNPDYGTDPTIQTTTVPIETGEYQDIDVKVYCDPVQEIVLPWAAYDNSISLAGTNVCVDGNVDQKDAAEIIRSFKSDIAEGDTIEVEKASVTELSDSQDSLIVSVVAPKAGEVVIKFSCGPSLDDDETTLRQNTLTNGVFPIRQYRLSTIKARADVCLDNKLSVADGFFTKGKIEELETSAEGVPYINLFAR